MFESVNEILLCDHSNENSLQYSVCGWTWVWPFKWYLIIVYASAKLFDLHEIFLIFNFFWRASSFTVSLSSPLNSNIVAMSMVGWVMFTAFFFFTGKVIFSFKNDFKLKGPSFLSGNRFSCHHDQRGRFM